MLNKIMSDEGLYLCTVKGSKVYLAYSWFFIAIFIVMTFYPTVLAVIPDSNTVQAVLISVCYVLFLALSILIHEFFHAFTAQRFGWKVSRVVLNVFGGNTTFSTTPGAKDSQRAMVAFAGPLANLIIAAVAYVSIPFSPDITVALLVQSLYYVNLFVGIFNFLPAFPLDGGKVVESVINNFSSDKTLGLKVTAWIGRILCAALALWVLYPLMKGQQLQMTSAIIFIMLIMYLWQASTAALNALKPQVRMIKQSGLNVDPSAYLEKGDIVPPKEEGKNN